MATSMTLNHITTAVEPAVKKADGNLADAITSASADPSAVNLMIMQREMINLSMLTSMQSSMLKEYGDTLKGVVQKF